MPLGRQGKRNHKIGGVRLDCSSEIGWGEVMERVTHRQALNKFRCFDWC